jgi:hypothetical protein
LRNPAIALSTNYNHEYHRGASTNDNNCGDDDNRYDWSDYAEPNV